LVVLLFAAGALLALVLVNSLVMVCDHKNGVYLTIGLFTCIFLCLFFYIKKTYKSFG
jgi:hypothetical protein